MLSLDGPFKVHAEPGVAGGVKGSFSLDGTHGRYADLNWAEKLCIESSLLEADLYAK